MALTACDLLRFGLADLAKIFGQLRLQIQQLLPLEQVDLEMRSAFWPAGRLHECAALQVQVFEDLRELGRLAGGQSGR